MPSHLSNNGVEEVSPLGVASPFYLSLLENTFQGKVLSEAEFEISTTAQERKADPSILADSSITPRS